MEYCCETFQESRKICTDNEGYGVAIRASYHEPKNTFYIGSIRKKINYCPWCGFSFKEDQDANN